ncbi:hypothetical protein [Cellulomonas endophytica]|uniref:hypothetical protein n=1 Tax=Cellulomonas endophytica TaxID=2494735 RepID=UPI0013E956D8|nr:hypothetical protein [Cellulomonas endophytica]
MKGTPLDIAVEAVHQTGQTTRLGLSVLGGLSILNAPSAIGTIEIAVRPGMEEAVITKLAP